MDQQKIIDIMISQKNCFQRDCNECSGCPYRLEQKDVVLAYNEVIDMVKSQKRMKTEFFNSGIEYSKSEFSKLIEKEKAHVDELHKNKVINDLAYLQILGLQKALELILDIKKK